MSIEVDVKFDFDEDKLYELQVDFECPICNHKLPLKLKQFKDEEIVECTECNSKIQLESTGS